jgi:hypothetical protein
MRFLKPSIHIVVALLLMSLSRSASAQTHEFVFTPLVGIYAPTTNVAKSTISDGQMSVTSSLRQRAAVIYGGTLSYWLNGRVAIEGSTLYSHSHLEASMTAAEGGAPIAGSRADDASLWLGTMKVLVQLRPPASGFNMRFGFGPAIITRGGPAYQSNTEGTPTGLTDVGAALSLCTRIPMTNKLSIRLRAEDYMYRAKLGWADLDPNSSYMFGSGTNNDFVFSLGLQFMLNR